LWRTLIPSALMTNEFNTYEERKEKIVCAIAADSLLTDREKKRKRKHKLTHRY